MKDYPVHSRGVSKNMAANSDRHIGTKPKLDTRIERKVHRILRGTGGVLSVLEGCLACSMRSIRIVHQEEWELNFRDTGGESPSGRKNPAITLI